MGTVCVDELLELPEVVELVKQFLESHAPDCVNVNSAPVTMPHYLYSALALVALTGLEVVARRKEELQQQAAERN